jgi:hypothetical protein
MHIVVLLRLGLCVLLAVGLSGCAARHFVQIAEGLTSATIAEGIRVAPRMFSAPALAAVCQRAVVVKRLEVAPDTLELSRGTPFSLNSLAVVAVDGSNAAVAGLPIVLEVEDRQPPVLALRSDNRELDEGRVVAAGAGRFRMRIRTICGNPYAETVIEGVVR